MIFLRVIKFPLDCVQPDIDYYQIIKLQSLNLKMILNWNIFRKIVPFIQG